MEDFLDHKTLRTQRGLTLNIVYRRVLGSEVLSLNVLSFMAVDALHCTYMSLIIGPLSLYS